MGVNSSYGCAFYPWVKIRDNVNDALLYVPPSVVALGTLSSSQRKSAVWFAPAGFTRGGLSEGSSGLSVIGVRQRLTSADRDKLYDANVNPIASFPAEGIVIFGQKTLQVTPSALDRINVRRLLIHVKKEISRISSTLLFEQNVQATWNRFLGEVRPFLQNIKSGLGLTDFKVVLDETTTTPDLVDRNVLYAKIFLKPARAIEFIALDFIIMRSGASFDD
jgi:phage tail sheath protein FI